MPDFAVASSKRIVLGTAPCCTFGCSACASLALLDALATAGKMPALQRAGMKNNDRRRMARNCFVTLVSSRGVLRGRASHVGRRGGLEQDHGNRILRRSFRSGMASDTGTLLAATHPEESRFVLQSFAGAIQQFDLQRFFGWHLNEE